VLLRLPLTVPILLCTRAWAMLVDLTKRCLLWGVDVWRVGCMRLDCAWVRLLRVISRGCPRARRMRKAVGSPCLSPLGEAFTDVCRYRCRCPTAQAVPARILSALAGERGAPVSGECCRSSASAHGGDARCHTARDA